MIRVGVCTFSEDRVQAGWYTDNWAGQRAKSPGGREDFSSCSASLFSSPSYPSMFFSLSESQCFFLFLFPCTWAFIICVQSFPHLVPSCDLLCAVFMPMFQNLRYFISSFVSLCPLQHFSFSLFCLLSLCLIWSSEKATLSPSLSVSLSLSLARSPASFVY